MSERLNIFLSYAQEDYELLEELKKHLALMDNQGLITLWGEYAITAGSVGEYEIDNRLNRADIILLCVSSDFMASKYSYSVEMQHAMIRHERGEARVIPVLFRTVDLEDAHFQKIRKLPDNAIPVISHKWHSRDEAFTNIARGIRKVIAEIQAGHRPNPLQEKLLSVEHLEKLTHTSLAEFKKRIPELSLPKATPEPLPSPSANLFSSPHVQLIYTGHANIISSISWSPDGRYIASGDQDGIIQVWEPGTGKSILSVTARGWLPEKRQVWEILWSPDSQYVAAHIQSKDSSRVFTWHVETQKQLQYIGYRYLPRSHTSCFAWSPDSRYLTMDDKLLYTKAKIGVWEIEAKKQVALYAKHTSEPITSLAWSPTGKKIASGDAEGNVHIWDRNGQPIYPIHTSITNVKVAWSPDGAYLALGGDKGHVQIWRSNTGKQTEMYPVAGSVNWMRWIQGGAYFACSDGSSSQSLTIWNSKTKHVLFSTPQKGFLSIGGRQFASLHDDTSIQLQDIETSSVVYTYRDHPTKVTTFAWSPDDQRIASGCVDTTIHVWQIPRATTG